MILTDEKYWTNAQQFIPQRFLENGEYMKTRPKAYIPFGIGCRLYVLVKNWPLRNCIPGCIVNFLQLIKRI